MTQPQVRLTPAAQRQLQAIGAGAGSVPILRLSVLGGGCSGLQYGFALETQDRLASDDTHYTEAAVAWVVDPKSLPYVLGAEIDYIRDLTGSRFVVRNPNARSTCGCGASFDVADPIPKPCLKTEFDG